MKRPRIAFVVSSDSTAKVFLAGHMAALSEAYDVALVADTHDPRLLRTMGVSGSTYPVAIVRKIAPLRDLLALAALLRLFWIEGFDAVHSVTPKAGLLAMMAAKAAGVKVRTHSFTGQVWATKSGAARLVLKLFDRLIHALTTFSLVDSGSQRDFLIEQGVLKAAASGILADGSICGVDADRFHPDKVARREVRAELSLREDDIVFLYLGRLTRDKGLLDLAAAFQAIHGGLPRTRLVFVGPDEEGLRGEIERTLGQALASTRFVPFTPVPERYMAACDVFCLPSYREGFGSVLIEAAAAGAPALASRIYGITDAVEDGVGGFLHEPRDVERIAELMERLASDPVLRAKLADAARTRALDKFSSKRLSEAMKDYYARSL